MSKCQIVIQTFELFSSHARQINPKVRKHQTKVQILYSPSATLMVPMYEQNILERDIKQYAINQIR